MKNKNWELMKCTDFSLPGLSKSFSFHTWKTAEKEYIMYMIWNYVSANFSPPGAVYFLNSRVSTPVVDLDNTKPRRLDSTDDQCTFLKNLTKRDKQNQNTEKFLQKALRCLYK